MGFSVPREDIGVSTPMESAKDVINDTLKGMEEQDEFTWQAEEEVGDLRSVYEETSHLTRQEKMNRLDSLLEKASAYSNFLVTNMPTTTTIEHAGEEKVMEKENEISSTSKSTKEKKRKVAAAVAVQSKVSHKKSKIKTDDAVKTSSPEVENKLKDEGQIVFQQPPLVTGGTLRSYQLEGVRWMCNLFENGLNGILADEMGLGKTVQVISLFAQLRSLGVRGPFLITTPLSTVPNWVQEFKRWTPSIPVVFYHGTPLERTEIRRKSLQAKNQHEENFPVLVTSYEVLLRDRKYFDNFVWKYIVVDEGHRLKNMNCRLIRELKRLNSENRLLLTGTPLQNNLSELWSLLNFILPDVFDDLEMFESWFAFDGLETSTSSVVSQQKNDQIISKLHEILRPFLLRRLKSQVVKNLPGKREVVVYAPLSEMQKEFYVLIKDGKLEEVLKEKYGKQLVGCKTNTLRNKMMQLRKCCNHPYLIDEPDNVEVSNEGLVEASGKMKLLDTMLQVLHKKGHKVLIFSQMTSMLDIIEDYLHLKKLKCCRIDGSTKLDARDQQMKSFNAQEDLFCFLLSTRAGGLGINLTGADTVIIYDSDWNPQQDNQAQDRCHRLGQTKPVAIYRLITENSVENRMLQRTNTKKKLERVVIQRGDFKQVGETLLKDLSTAELNNLLQDDISLRHGETGGISPEELALVLDRDVLMGIRSPSESTELLPRQGHGYEIIVQGTSDLDLGSLN